MKLNEQVKSPNGNGKTNGHKSNLDIFIENRRKRLNEIYGREFTQDEIEEIRGKIYQAKEKADKVREEWGIL